MKQRLNPVILIISLAIIGFFVGVYFPRVWDVFFSPAPFVFTVWESAISLVLLLLICLLCARIILWVYSRIQVPNYPMRSLVLSFLILMATPLLCIGIGFQQYQLLLSKLPDQHAGIPVSTGYINFFGQGLAIVLLTSAIITIILLWITRGRKQKEFANSSVKEKKQDIVLVISTLIIFAFALNMMVKFVTMTIFVWSFGG